MPLPNQPSEQSGTTSPERRPRSRARVTLLLGAVALIALLVLVGMEDAKWRFCTAAGAVPLVDLDVGLVAGAERACLDEVCAVVESGIARLEWNDADDYSAWREMKSVNVRILGGAGQTLLTRDRVAIPRSYPNGPDCETDGPAGEMTLSETGEITQRP